MEQGELKIIAAFKQKDAKAFAYIFKLHRKALVYFAEKILGIRQEAEDIVADSFMKLWDKHADFDSLPQIKSFLYVVTRNSCLNFLKYSKRVSASQMEYSYWADSKEDEILHIMYRAELLLELNSEIEILPQEMKEVFGLSFFHELSPGEIADKLGLSVKTVRDQKAKAVLLIRTAFLKRNLAIAFMGLMDTLTSVF
jgi:RNA polymerase sigma-70 factor (ECF subfamily)